ncbi:ABC-type transport auxiliary lipoprotein family protein [Pseudomonas anguilliseptica]|uniref:ABC-type transport auxiliary lipoprotein family protein n=1 Tax=Pseudomonas anguilliseptica TaxID=53406 RepID=UPI001F3165E2|nr:ABC-type transport auxiliary lipoprotein family protein [Pseudomonas anguilliseptica]MCE5361839.1 membrane integrity-associated transporter subunit PqiC [Pseudomonas anguilliseptica]
MSRLRLLATLLLIGSLSACSILPKSQVLSIYRLPASSLPSHNVSANWALRVNKPYSSQLLDSTRIAVLPPGDQISAYQGVRWSDRAPLLLRDRLIDAFLDDGRLKAVSSDDSRLQADLELDGDLRAFHSEYQNGRPAARILFEARLVESGSLRILASRRFEVSQTASDTSLPAVVNAFGQAGDQLARDVLEWTLNQGQTAYTRTIN